MVKVLIVHSHPQQGLEAFLEHGIWVLANTSAAKHWCVNSDLPDLYPSYPDERRSELGLILCGGRLGRAGERMLNQKGLKLPWIFP